MKQIALAFPMGVSHLERVAYGISKFAREQGDWQLVTNPERHNLEIRQLAEWRGDGIIGFINTLEEGDFVKNLNIPVVNLSGALAESPFPRVRVNYYKLGELAAEHLISRGLKNFAYYGIQNVWYAQVIGSGFRENLIDSIHFFSRYDAGSTLNGNWSGGGKELEDWLQSLPKPVGLLAAHDPRALEILQTCQRVGIKVPEEISLMGINNDAITCELVHPTLTSIPRNGEEIGYQAANLLNKILKKEQILPKDLVIEPLKVLERESTSYLAVNNSTLLTAISYIEKNSYKNINIKNVCQSISRSRRWLEYAFMQELKMTPLQFLNETRVRKAISLISLNQNLKLSKIAQMAGFSNSEQMNKIFKQINGKTASEFKKIN